MSLQLVEGRLFTSSYDGCLKVWDVSELGNGTDPLFKLRYPPRGQLSDTDKDKEQTKEIEKYGGLGVLDKNQNNNPPQHDKIMIE